MTYRGRALLKGTRVSGEKPMGAASPFRHCASSPLPHLPFQTPEPAPMAMSTVFNGAHITVIHAHSRHGGQGFCSRNALLCFHPRYTGNGLFPHHFWMFETHRR